MNIIIKKSGLILFLVALLVAVGQSTLKGRPVVTAVVALYDINRISVRGKQKRPFSFYLDRFAQLLKAPTNLIIFGNSELKKFVWERRNSSNTVFIQRQITWFDEQWWKPFIKPIQRNHSQTPWMWRKIANHAGNALDYYVPVTISKTYYLQEATKQDIFHSDFFVWHDGGLTHKFNAQVAYPYNKIQLMFHAAQPTWFVHQYSGIQPFTGFHRGQRGYIKHKVGRRRRVCTNYFGGQASIIRDYRSIFQNLFRITLQNNDMDNDQSIVTLMVYRQTVIFPTAVYGDIFPIETFQYNIPHYLKQKLQRIFSVNIQNNLLKQQKQKDLLVEKLIQYEREQQLFRTAQLDLKVSKISQFYYNRESILMNMLLTTLFYLTGLTLILVYIKINRLYMIQRKQESQDKMQKQENFFRAFT